MSNSLLNDSICPQLWPKSGYVKLTKLSAYKMPDGALSLNYWLKGQLLYSLKIGEPIKVLRYERAKREPWESEVVKCMGDFESSPIVEMNRISFTEAQIQTENLLWRVEFIAPPRVAESLQEGGNVS